MLPMLYPMLLGRTGAIPLVQVVRAAPLIVVGHIEDLDLVEGHRIATLATDRTLKGKAPKRIRFFAESTWICDRSTPHAQVGDRGIYLLRPFAFSPSGKRGGVAVSEALSASHRGRPLFHAAAIGRSARAETLGKLGNGWYYGPYIMPHAVPPSRDLAGKPYYGEDRLRYAILRSLDQKPSRTRTR